MLFTDDHLQTVLARIEKRAPLVTPALNKGIWLSQRYYQLNRGTIEEETHSLWSDVLISSNQVCAPSAGYRAGSTVVFRSSVETAPSTGVTC